MISLEFSDATVKPSVAESCKTGICNCLSNDSQVDPLITLFHKVIGNLITDTRLQTVLLDGKNYRYSVSDNFLSIHLEVKPDGIKNGDVIYAITFPTYKAHQLIANDTCRLLGIPALSDEEMRKKAENKENVLAAVRQNRYPTESLVPLSDKDPEREAVQEN